MVSGRVLHAMDADVEIGRVSRLDTHLLSVVHRAHALLIQNLRELAHGVA